MATYRCKTCRGLYIDPQPSGVPYYHACPPDVDPKTGRATPTKNARDENVVADVIMGKAPGDGHTVTPEAARVRMKAHGLGREVMAPGDVLSAADAAAVAALHQAAGQGAPDPPDHGPVVTILPPPPPPRPGP